MAPFEVHYVGAGLGAYEKGEAAASIQGCCDLVGDSRPLDKCSTRSLASNSSA